MKFVTVERDGKAVPGVVTASGDKIVELTAILPEGSTLTDLISMGSEGMARAAQALDEARSEQRFSLNGCKFLAPIPRPPRNIICVGKNYHDHAEEFQKSGFDTTGGQNAVPDHPIIFSKSLTTIIGPGAPIPASSDPTGSVDYEVELGVVIGTGGRNIPKEEALKHVFGYTIINDVTSRKLQARHRQWFLGKNLDGFCPMGPYIVSDDDVGDVADLRVKAMINGEVRQDASVKDLIFDIPTLIATISSIMTLLPGDIIATGTPAGVGIGFDPPKFLAPGDEVRMEITRLGSLENPVS